MNIDSVICSQCMSCMYNLCSLLHCTWPLMPLFFCPPYFKYEDEFHLYLSQSCSSGCCHILENIENNCQDLLLLSLKNNYIVIGLFTLATPSEQENKTVTNIR